MILHPAMANPIAVVITDRHDLDDQSFGAFARWRDPLRQPRTQPRSEPTYLGFVAIVFSRGETDC